MVMKNVLLILFLNFLVYLPAQKKTIVKPNNSTIKKTLVSTTTKAVIKLNDSIPTHIPSKIDGKFGFVDQYGKMIIAPIYSNVGFFTEDCNLLHSKNSKVRKFGSSDYASVRLGEMDFRINKSGKRVYYFNDSDLGKCNSEFKTQLFHAYIMNQAYGIIEDSKFENPGDYRQFTIYPQYDYLHIMEGDDLKNPMIIASKNNKFGIIDVNNKVIVPFEYSDIKRNYSWKLARLFEVTKDGKNYYYIDVNQKAY